MEDEVVLYHPVKSASFGHALSKRDKSKAFDELQNFVVNHLSMKIDSPISLQLYEGSTFYEACYAQVVEAFGPPESKCGRVSSWKIITDDLNKAIEIGLQKRETKAMDPFRLSFSYLFKWNNENMMQEVINNFTDSIDQQFHSWVRITISHNIFVQPYFIFPFNPDEPQLKSFIHHLSRDLPFTFNSKYFRRLSKNKSNNGIKYRKMDRNWSLA